MPVMSVITTIDVDHMDTYGHDLARLKSAFIEFTQRLRFYGSAILCTDDPNVREIIPFVSRPITTYGIDSDARVRAINVRQQGTEMCVEVQRKSPTGALPELSVCVNCPWRRTGPQG